MDWQHEWPPLVDNALPADARCIHCGTTFVFNAAKPQNCVPGARMHDPEMRPEPSRREYAVNDADTIHARLAELRDQRTAAMNQTTIEEETG